MTRLSGFDDLVALLEGGKFPHVLHRDQHLVELPGDPGLPGPLLVRWTPGARFVQMVQIMLGDLLGDRLGEVETAVVRLNFLLETPAFGIDHKLRRLHARLAVPIFDEGIDALAFHVLGTGCVRFATDYLPVFRAVVDGKPGASVTAKPA